MFQLRIELSSDSVEVIKASLNSTVPEVKSSHRCEAAARALGFKTYASLRANVRDNIIIEVTVDGLAFVSYLADHGFPDAAAPAIYIAGAEVALMAAKEKEPLLTVGGIGVGPRMRGDDGKRESGAAYKERFSVDRRWLGGRYAAEEFLRGLEFMSRVERTKVITSAYGSYNLKHIAEKAACKYPTGELLGPDYVSNGALIAAAIHAGFKWKISIDSETGAHFPNAMFNASTKSLRDLDAEIRPSQVRAA